MAPIDAPSPYPAMPPPNNKRPRQSASNGNSASNTAAIGGAGTGGAGPSRSKRKKLDDGPVAGETGTVRGSGGGVGAGSARARARQGDVGDKEDEGELAEGEIVTKIDFKTLPPETLYKYLELHELLPKWSVSPWSEEPVVQPHMLYTSPPRPVNGQPSPSTATPAPDRDRSASIIRDPTVETPDDRKPDMDIEMPLNDTNGNEEPADDIPVVAPTTRSKTAPHRKPATPPQQTPGPEVRERTLTLSDVIVARDVLAEKANAHWMKGLGGGQNKEGETIVNFLYKMKVGPGRLLRVYNPAYPAYGNHAQ